MISKRTIGISVLLVLLVLVLKLLLDGYTLKKTISSILSLIIVLSLTLGILYIMTKFTPHHTTTPLYADINGNTHTTLSLYKLSPYIARKIYDLAVLENEHCSITHEKFTLGNVAVMPCGHIYSKNALCTYFFTINDKKCLICKYDGVPVYL
jgi:hypothetical protein